MGMLNIHILILIIVLPVLITSFSTSTNNYLKSLSLSNAVKDSFMMNSGNVAKNDINKSLTQRMFEKLPTVSRDQYVEPTNAIYFIVFG